MGVRSGGATVDHQAMYSLLAAVGFFLCLWGWLVLVKKRDEGALPATVTVAVAFLLWTFYFVWRLVGDFRSHAAIGYCLVHAVLLIVMVFAALDHGRRALRLSRSRRSASANQSNGSL